MFMYVKIVKQVQQNRKQKATTKQKQHIDTEKHIEQNITKQKQKNRYRHKTEIQYINRKQIFLNPYPNPNTQP